MLKERFEELYGEGRGTHRSMPYLQKYIYDQGFQYRIELLQSLLTVECSKFGDGWYSDQKDATQFHEKFNFSAEDVDIDELILNGLTAIAEWVCAEMKLVAEIQPVIAPTVQAVAFIFGIEPEDIYDIVIYDTGKMDLLFLNYETASKYGLGRVHEITYHEVAKFAVQESQDAFVIKAIQVLYDKGILAFLRRAATWIVEIVDERTSVTYNEKFTGAYPALAMVDAIEDYLYRENVQ